VQYESPSQQDAWIGRTIAGRFELVEHLASGASSLVYKAHQWPLGRPVAIKVLVPNEAARERSIRRFVNEARILSRLRHPNTLGLIDFGRTEEGDLYMVTDFVGGGTLRDLMLGRRVDVAVALRLARDIARALAEAHAQGVIHRDLKPENVLLEEVRGGELVPRLADFGLAKEDPAEQPGPREEVTKPRTRLGTPGYMSPEQAFFQTVDPSADLYALGAVLYEMITGHPVFALESRDDLYFAHRYDAPPAFATTAPDLHVDPRVEELVIQLLGKTAGERPESADAVVARLDALLRDIDPAEQLTTPAPPRPEPPSALVEPPPEAPLKRRLMTGALVSLLFIVVTVLVV
jgi:eukaryotic-like serine/threonine-protein kinase